MKKLKLTNGLITFVDDDNYEELKKYSWIPFKHRRNGNIYPRNPKTRQYIHRVIMGVTDPKIQVDHKNMNPLDNRKENLRICEKGALNAINRPKQKNNTSGYKGVFIRENGRFRAAIRVNQRLLHIGTFQNKIDAARAYNEAAIKYFGEFAHLNEV